MNFIENRLNEIQKILKDYVDISSEKYNFPEIIIIGDEKNGKSTLLELLTKFDIFPKDRIICTSRPIRFIIKRGMYSEFIIKGISKKDLHFIDKNDVYNYINDYFKKENDISIEEIIVIYTSPENYNFQFVDLPGIKSHPYDLSIKTKNITNYYLENKSNIIILAYSSLTTTISNCSTLSLIKDNKREKDVILAMTMIDKCNSIDLEFVKSQKILDNENIFYISNSIKDSELNLLIHLKNILNDYINKIWYKKIINDLENEKIIFNENKNAINPLKTDDDIAYKCILNMIYDRMNKYPKFTDYCDFIELNNKSSTSKFKNGNFIISKNDEYQTIGNYKVYEEIKDTFIENWIFRVVSEFKHNVNKFINGDICPSSEINGKFFCNSDIGTKFDKCNILKSLGLECSSMEGRRKVSINNYTIYSDSLTNFCNTMITNLTKAASTIMNMKKYILLYETIVYKISSCIDYSQDLENWYDLKYDFDDDSLLIPNKNILDKQNIIQEKINELNNIMLEIKIITGNGLKIPQRPKKTN